MEFPLFVSHRRLSRVQRLPRARCDWALDSGGFSELTLFGEWRTSATDYVAAVRRYRTEIGRMEWAAIQDWMCEPWLLKKTGLSIAEHQRRTVDSFLELTSRAPEIPWTPVLQGWEDTDYFRHIEAYSRRGVDLAACPVVGLGSVCRRQHTDEIEALVRTIAATGLRLHGFGVKTKGLARVASLLHSADSLSWSFAGRYEKPLPGCKGHKNDANCLRWAKKWRTQLLRGIA